MSEYIFPTCRACPKWENCRTDCAIKTEYMDELLPILQFAVRVGLETGRIPDWSVCRSEDGEPARICEVCGKPLPPGLQKVCSAECRRYLQPHESEKKLFCPVCGKPLIAGRHKYCSEGCMKQAARQRAKEFMQRKRRERRG